MVNHYNILRLNISITIPSSLLLNPSQCKKKQINSFQKIVYLQQNLDVNMASNIFLHFTGKKIKSTLVEFITQLSQRIGIAFVHLSEKPKTSRNRKQTLFQEKTTRREKLKCTTDDNYDVSQSKAFIVTNSIGMMNALC